MARHFAVLLAYLVYTLPVQAMPLALLRPAAPQASAAYPCAGHHCGCRTAAQCLLHCCCRRGTDGASLPQPADPVLAAAACHGDGLPAAPNLLRDHPHVPPPAALARRRDPGTPWAAAAAPGPRQLTLEPPDQVPRAA